MKLDDKVMDAIIAGLQGRNAKGEQNTGLIMAMMPDTARRLIRDALAALR